jgi:hypothetical protein
MQKGARAPHTRWCTRVQTLDDMFTQVLQQHKERKAASLAEIGSVAERMSAVLWLVLVLRPADGLHFTALIQSPAKTCPCVHNIDLKEREAQAAIESHASFVLDRLNSGAATVYANQQRIEAEAAQVSISAGQNANDQHPQKRSD